MRWTVSRHLSRHELRTAGDPAPASRPVRFADLAEAREFLRPLLGDPFNHDVLREAARAVSLARAAGGDRDLADELADQLVSGRLLVATSDEALEQRLVARAEPVRKIAREVGDLFEQLQRGVETDWIEVQLVDTEGRGVPNTRYEITTPDGQVHRGYTNSLGEARLTRIPSGACTICFPDLDGGAWSAA